jgi:protein TonB
MRHGLAFLFPVVLLAACKRASEFDKADGSFDRAAYRASVMEQCRNALRGRPGGSSEAEMNSICACMADAEIAGSSDDQLREHRRRNGMPSDQARRITRQCSTPDEPPPPEEAPPAMDGSVPPAVVPDTAPGPARPSLPLARYLSPDDYPPAAMRNNEQGTVAFILDISPEGRVTNCRITQSSGSAALDSTTCRIMRSRARFHPARNAQGVAIAGTGSARVTWRLPED